MQTTKEQRAARKAQGYDAKPKQRVCGTCVQMGVKYIKRIDEEAGWDTSYDQAWCLAGDFPTKRTATCGRDYKEKA